MTDSLNYTPKIILIADAGSTKTDWAILRAGSDTTEYLCGPGVNPATMTTSERFSNLKDVLGSVQFRPDAVRFFGAGCATESLNSALAADIKEICGADDVVVASDLVGAAKSIIGDGAGIVCILGTGSNACRVEGGKVIDSIPSLGYVLGDEGSGNALGRRFCSNLLKRRLPAEITEKAVASLSLTVDNVIDRVYRKPGANVWLASLVPFLVENQDNEAVSELIDTELESFFERCILPLCHGGEEVGFIGSVAAVFENRLRKLATSKGLKIGKIARKPITGLTDYYSNIINNKNYKQ